MSKQIEKVSFAWTLLLGITAWIVIAFFATVAYHTIVK